MKLPYKHNDQSPSLDRLEVSPKFIRTLRNEVFRRNTSFYHDLDELAVALDMANACCFDCWFQAKVEHETVQQFPERMHQTEAQRERDSYGAVHLASGIRYRMAAVWCEADDEAQQAETEAK